jgi:leucyl-tRNA synthetase
MVHKDGDVMSKSKGNTVAPDDMIDRYGADTLRLYILFVAPPELPLEWSDENIAGAHRFVNKVWRLVDRQAEAPAAAPALPRELPATARDLRRKVHQTVAKVTRDIEDRLQMNTAVAAMMELYNTIVELEAKVATEEGGPGVLREALETLVLLLNPFTPHLCEELAERLGRRGGLVRAPWPVADPLAAREEALELAVQVNGKVRGHVTVPRDAREEDVRRWALADPKVAEHVKGKEIAKVVVVPGRLVSVVTR